MIAGIDIENGSGGHDYAQFRGDLLSIGHSSEHFCEDLALLNIVKFVRSDACRLRHLIVRSLPCIASIAVR